MHSNPVCADIFIKYKYAFSASRNSSTLNVNGSWIILYVCLTWSNYGCGWPRGAFHQQSCILPSIIPAPDCKVWMWLSLRADLSFWYYHHIINEINIIKFCLIYFLVFHGYRLYQHIVVELRCHYLSEDIFIFSHFLYKHYFISA